MVDHPTQCDIGQTGPILRITSTDVSMIACKPNLLERLQYILFPTAANGSAAIL